MHSDHTYFEVILTPNVAQTLAQVASDVMYMSAERNAVAVAGRLAIVLPHPNTEHLVPIVTPSGASGIDAIYRFPPKAFVGTARTAILKSDTPLFGT